MKKTVLVLLAGAALFTACKKSDNGTTTQQKIVNKWSVVSDAGVDFYSGVAHPYTYTGVATDYVDFRSDGKVYSNYGGSLDTTIYSIISDQLIKIDTDTSQIKTLTDNSFVLYNKQTSGANYSESTITLKK